jgi:hypothetical protein
LVNVLLNKKVDLVEKVVFENSKSPVIITSLNNLKSLIPDYKEE